MITIKVSRFNPGKDDEAYFEEFQIEEKEKMKVLDALNYINEEYSANIAFRSSCRAGQCGSCAVKLNGEVVLACKAEIKDKDMLEPIDLDVIKDLIVDRSDIDKEISESALFLDECEEGKTKTCAIINPLKCSDTKKIRSCIECYSCISACPVLKVTDEYSGPFLMRYLSKFALDPRDCGEETALAVDKGIYSCTSCGKCADVCPKEIAIMGDAIEKLRYLVSEDGLGPLQPQIDTYERVKKTGRSVNHKDESFIEAIANNPDLIDKNSNIAFFTGCMTDYRLQNVAFTLLKVLDKIGIKVDVPLNQTCCGSPLIRTGQLGIIEDLIKENEEALTKYDTIITVCAGCGATLKNDYPKYGVNLNVLDISEFLLDKLDFNKMKSLNMKVTFHDPCHLVRGQGITDEPREIIKKIPGIEFIEMNEADTCCGSGGGVKAGKPELAAKLGERKAKNIKEANVDAVITICPFCQYHIIDSLEKEGLGDIKVMNMLELIEMAIDD